MLTFFVLFKKYRLAIKTAINWLGSKGGKVRLPNDNI